VKFILDAQPVKRFDGKVGKLTSWHSCVSRGKLGFGINALTQPDQPSLGRQLTQRGINARGRTQLQKILTQNYRPSAFSDGPANSLKGLSHASIIYQNENIANSLLSNI
jgi:hypothetical protein